MQLYCTIEMYISCFTKIYMVIISYLTVHYMCQFEYRKLFLYEYTHRVGKMVSNMIYSIYLGGASFPSERKCALLHFYTY